MDDGRQHEPEKKLRTGFSTGSCAAAAAKAATAALLSGKSQSEVTILLPNRTPVRFTVARCELSTRSATCSIIKDAGDDPDVTHGAEICATVELSEEPAIALIGGEGVGKVTRVGLGLEIGEPDITRVPRRMITESVRHALDEQKRGDVGARVTIWVPNGAELAKKTLLPRLGVIGGIGILGSNGLVTPFSTAAFRASIARAIDVALSAGQRELVFTTGGQSEKFAMALLPHLPELAFIEMGDFAGYAVSSAARRGVSHAIFAGMIGKLSKIADGKKMTHAAGSKVNLELLAGMARKLGAPAPVAAQIEGANTARHALELALSAGFAALADEVCAAAAEHLRHFAGADLPVSVMLTDFDGKLLGLYAADPALSHLLKENRPGNVRV
jgi:cobalt-precorrin-5B (C1)-methyltransferase